MDFEEFTTACREALREDTPSLAVKEVVAAGLAGLGTPHGPLVDDVGVKILHRADDLTVLHVMIPPGLPSTLPHDHLMWAVVGVYLGREDNAFFRRDGASLTGSGGRSLHAGDALALGADAIHAIENPSDRQPLCALHVYGGDLVAANRSMWLRDTFEELPYDDRRVFERSAPQ